MNYFKVETTTLQIKNKQQPLWSLIGGLINYEEDQSLR